MRLDASQLLRLRRRVSTNTLAWVGATGILLVVLAAVLAPLISPYDPMAMQTSRRFLAAGTPGHLLGTDEFGRDVLSRIIWGGRISLLVAPSTPSRCASSTWSSLSRR